MFFEVVRSSVECQIFQFSVGIHDDSTTGIFINATALKADETVFYEIDNANTVSGTNSIQFRYQFEGIHLFAVNSNRNPFFKLQFYIFRCIRCFFRLRRNHVYHIFRSICRIFQIITFVAQMPDVPVHAVGIRIFFRFVINRHIMCFRIFDFIFTGFKIPHSPRCNQFDFWSQRFNRQFEPYLVVAFSCSAVGNSVSAFFFGNFYEFFGNQRPGKGCTQEIFAFIYSVRFHAGPYIVFHKFFFNIHNVCFGSTGFDSLLFNGFKIIRLSYVSAGCNNFCTGIVFLQPGNNAGCIQTTGIG